MKRRAGTDDASKQEGKGGFISFQPKKFRPQKPSSMQSKNKKELIVNATEHQLQNESQVHLSDADLKHLQGGSKANNVTIELGTISAGTIQASALRNKTTGQGVAFIQSAEIPDDATYKTEIEIAANFNCSGIFSKYFECEQTGLPERIVELLRKTHEQWKEVQTVWCYPHPPDSFLALATNRDCKVTSGEKRNVIQTESACALWVTSVLSVSQLFLNGALDSFLIYSPREKDNVSKFSLSANFYIDLDPITSEKRHCCVIAGVSIFFMKRLQARGVVFEVMLSHQTFDEVFSEALPKNLSADISLDCEANFEGIAISRLSSGELYKLRVLRKESIKAAVDLIMDHSVSKILEGISAGVDAILPQVVSPRPFSYAFAMEASLVSSKVLSAETLMESAAAHRNGTLSVETVPGRSWRTVLRGYFSTDALQALAALMTVVALSSRKHINDKNATENFAGRVELIEKEFIDDTIFESVYIRQMNQIKSNLQKPVVPSLKDPMRLTTSTSKSSVFTPIAAPSQPGKINDRLPTFSILAKNYCGVPFLSKVSVSRKGKCGIPLAYPCVQGFICRELNWISEDDNLFDQFEMLSKYRISLYREAIQHPLEVLSFSKERQRQIEAAGDVLVLKPSNEYSIYAD